MLKTWLAPLLALAISAGITGFFLASRLGLRWAPDQPNQRSLHAHPVPRLGGVGILLAIVVVCHGAAAAVWPIPWLAGALFGISLLDDLRGLPLLVRFSSHILAALAFVFSMSPEFPVPVALLLVVVIVWSTNLYNFMDGANGLAGGMALIGFGMLGGVALGAGEPVLALYCLAVAGAAAGFLLFNFDPARIFMGDCGSIPLGFLAATLSTWGWHRGIWSLSLPLLVFFPFLADATVTLAKRMLRGERFWMPHREHYYQRLVRMGLSHGRLALIAYLAMLSGGAIGWAAQWLSANWQAGIVLAVCLLWSVIFHWIDKAWARFAENACVMPIDSPNESSGF